MRGVRCLAGAAIPPFLATRALSHIELCTTHGDILTWAMSRLISQDSSQAVNGAANGLSAGLLTLYCSMIQHIPSKELDTFRNVLHWVTLAARPLSVDELTAAVTVHKPGDVDDWQASRKYIKLCEPFVLVRNDEVFLAHQSFDHYLLSQQKDGNLVVEHLRKSFVTAHLSLAKVCLDSLGKASTLSNYAKLHWPYHFKECPAQVQVALITDDPFFRKGSAVRHSWWKSDHKRSQSRLDNGLSLDFRMACYLGLEVWAKMILAKQASGRYSCLQFVPEERSFKIQVCMRPARTGKPSRKQTRLRSQLAKLFSSKDRLKPTKDQESSADLFGVLRHEPNALYYAALGGGGPQIVSFLLTNGSDPNARNSFEESPLSIAAIQPQLDVMRLLLTHGADPNGSLMKTDRVQMTPLCHAVGGSGTPEAVTLLLESGASIQVADGCMTRSVGLTLLQLAASKGSKLLVQLLLEYGADLRAAKNGKPIPLCLAIEGGHNKVVDLLLDYTTAFTNLHTPCTSLPLYTALACKRRKIARKLIQCGDAPNTSSTAAMKLWSAIINGNVANVQSKMKQGVDPNVATPVSQGCPGGLTSLHWAVIEWQHRGYNAFTLRDYGAIVRELLEHGADAGLVDAQGKTALEYAHKGDGVWDAVTNVMARSRETSYYCNLDLLRTGGTRRLC